ncbi:MAG: DUF11 domain-containing protein [Acidobacteriota bacterium]
MSTWKSILRISLGTVLVAGLALAPVAAQTAQEQAELDADAAGVPGTPGTGSLGGIVCPSGSPTDFYFNDFETDDGGWTVGGAGDWERGTTVNGVFDDCDTTPRPEPPAGWGAWATNLDGCYANQSPSSASTLSQTFDFSSLTAPIEMSWEHWYEIFVSFDMGDVNVNGTNVFSVATTAATGPVTETVDLSAFAGMASVTIDFELFATTVVNRTGWAINDLRITTCGGESDLDITKTDDGGGSVAPGGTLVYTVTVTNNGPDDDTNVVVTDMLPAEVTYVSDDCGGINGPPWTWTIGALANGATAICNITVQVNDIEGPIVNTASVAGDNADNDGANDASTNTVVAQASILEIPTLGTIGFVLLVLLLLGSATLLMRRRQA